MAMALEASANPCAVRAELSASLQIVDEGTPLTCHEIAGGEIDKDGAPQAPDHEQAPCCCPGLLGSGIALDTIRVDAPVSVLAQWQTPMPDAALSRVLEHEPPPPRA